MYEVFFSDKAKSQFSKLPPQTKNRIGSALERIKIRPHNFVKRLYNSKYYRLRVDDYRLILDVKETQLIIHIIEVGHRSEIYKS